METKWRINDQGMTISPEKAKSERMHAARRARKKRRPNKDSYTGRKLVRLCPKCGEEIKKEKWLRRNDELGIYRDMKVYVCGKCNAVWQSAQTIKVWQRLKKNPPKQTNQEFKSRLQAF